MFVCMAEVTNDKKCMKLKAEFKTCMCIHLTYISAKKVFYNNDKVTLITQSARSAWRSFNFALFCFLSVSKVRLPR